MKFKVYKIFKSRNKRMFFWCGLGLLILMFVFGAFTNSPQPLNVYIAFGFIWLSVIVSVCVVYLSSGSNEKMRAMIKNGAIINVLTVIVVNLLMVRNFSIIPLVTVDFILLGLNFCYNLGLNYFYSFYKEANEK